jgi:Glycosyl hydrolase family 1
LGANPVAAGQLECVLEDVEMPSKAIVDQNTLTRLIYSLPMRISVLKYDEDSYVMYFLQAKQKGRIGILLDFVWYEPLTDSKGDEEAAQRARDFHVGWYHSRTHLILFFV